MQQVLIESLWGRSCQGCSLYASLGYFKSAVKGKRDYVVDNV